MMSSVTFREMLLASTSRNRNDKILESPRSQLTPFSHVTQLPQIILTSNSTDCFICLKCVSVNHTAYTFCVLLLH